MSSEYNAFITDASIESDGEGVLSGATVAVKDNISTKDVRTTCGSAMLASYEPPYDATVVRRVLDAGATIVGKANMDEFGMGGTTETSAFEPTENPRAPGHVAGGSSGGSAAAVAAGVADLALGTDTGGSIRNPAAFCGVVGLKPTYGLVSRYGLIAYANSLEQIGPIAPTVESTARLLDVIAGPDDHDGTTRTADLDGSYVDTLDGDVSGTTIGVLKNLTDGSDERVQTRFGAAIEALEAQGASIVEIELESVEHALAAYYVIAMSEASSNLARFDGVRYGVSGGYDGDWNEAFADGRNDGFGEEVKRRILLGTYALSAGYHDKYYKKAQDARAWVKSDFAEAFTQADVLASPTMPVLAPKIGENLDDPLALYQIDANTVPVNLANVPAISVPIGEADGRPVGLQLIAPAFGEGRLFRTASALE